MTDEDLAGLLNLSDTEAATILKSTQRAAYERLGQIALELDLWTAGLGPKPDGVVVCHKRRKR